MIIFNSLTCDVNFSSIYSNRVEISAWFAVMKLLHILNITKFQFYKIFAYHARWNFIASSDSNPGWKSLYIQSLDKNHFVWSKSKSWYLHLQSFITLWFLKKKHKKMYLALFFFLKNGWNFQILEIKKERFSRITNSFCTCLVIFLFILIILLV